MDSYLTVKSQTRTVLTVRKSKFIASVANVETEEEAKKFICAVKREFADATHHPYAYRIGEQEDFSDDGEPLNTAGKPILGAIESKKVTSLVIVVTRYFGGIKLGIGGLIRAYRDAAVQCIEAAEITERYYEEELSFSVAYEFFGGVSHVLETYECTILDEKMEKTVFFKVLIRKKDRDRFIDDLLRQTRGAVTVHF